MPIFDIFEQEKETSTYFDSSQPIPEAPIESLKDRFFSFAAARLFFLLLFFVDLLWIAVALVRLIGVELGYSLTLFKSPFFAAQVAKACVSIRRALVCGLALLIALCSPAFGIMIACTYFLMYDKAGIEEVVPKSLQEQFKEFFRQKDV